jgi:hypothetical protein
MMNEIRLRTSGDDMITAGNNNIVIGNDIKDPIGIILKNYSATESSVTRSFKIGYNAVGKFTILGIASQAGIESKKSLPFHVQ